MAIKIQSTFFSIMMILSSSILFSADLENNLEIFSKSTSLGVLNSESFPVLPNTVAIPETEYQRCSVDDITSEVKDFCRAEIKRLMQENYDNHQKPESVNKNQMSADQEAKKTNVKKGYFDIAADDTFECNKVAGVFSVLLVVTTSSFLKMITSYKEAPKVVVSTAAKGSAQEKNEIKVLKPKLKHRVQVSCRNALTRSIRTICPLGAGWITYKLISGNQEVKQSLCDNLATLKNGIKSDDLIPDQIYTFVKKGIKFDDLIPNQVYTAFQANKTK